MSDILDQIDIKAIHEVYGGVPAKIVSLLVGEIMDLRKPKTCKTCASWAVSPKENYGQCAEGITCGWSADTGWTPRDFGCARWEGREDS